MKQNIYEHLDLDEETMGSETANMKRKAEKKIKEIERLKSKINPTADETEKINSEKKWQKILHIFEPAKPDKDKNDKQKKRKREKKQKPKKPEKPDNNFFEKNFHDKERKPNIEQERPRIVINIVPTSDVQTEFEELLRKNNNIDKTFRQLSLKYHPDKNPDKKQWAEEKQKELARVRDIYVNIFQ
jgi:hypothetical protein